MSGPRDHVSSGRLAAPASIRRAIADAGARIAAVEDDGQVSTVYPALAGADPDRFGIALVGVDGATYMAGDAEVPFPIMSVSKPFVFALACEAVGPEVVRRRVGVNATGRPFDALEAIEADPAGRTNPMVNPGAIVTTGLIPGATGDARWTAILDGLSRFAGRSLEVDDAVYRSASETNHHNRALVKALQARGALGEDGPAALDRYTRQCAVRVTARDLAVMGATLADGGVNPVTGERVVDALTCHHALAVMVTAGLYEASGDWLWDVGLPGKSGIGGGIVTVSPGKAGLATYGPRLDASGNSVRGRIATAFLARRLGLDLLASRAAARSG